jgi:hypothetical protein
MAERLMNTWYKATTKATTPTVSGTENQANVVVNHERPTLLWSNIRYIISPEEVQHVPRQPYQRRGRATTIEMAIEMRKATLFITTTATKTRFDQLKKELHNNYISETKIVTLPHSNANYTRLNQTQII